MRRPSIFVLLLALTMPMIAESTGTLTLPVTFGSLSAGVQNLSLFDQVFVQIKNYINDRETTYGTLAARPAAGVHGRTYYANDTNQYFGDNGSAWVNLVAGAATGSYSIRGLQGANNSGTPTTQWDMSADLVALRSPTDGGISVRTNTGTITVNILTAGPAANGRDQAAAFTVNQWLHFYFIWNGTTLAGLVSSTPPPTGPALPTGYTAWAYAGFVRMGDTLVLTRWRGTKMMYVTASPVVSNGRTAGETTVVTASGVAPNATTVGLWAEVFETGTVAFAIRAVTGQNYNQILQPHAGENMQAAFEITIPNLSQQFFIFWTAAATNGASVSITNNGMPNGAE